MADRRPPLSKEATQLRLIVNSQRILIKSTEIERDGSSRTQENQAASKLLEEAQIARIQPANVVNAVPHHAEALNPQTSRETAVALWIQP